MHIFFRRGTAIEHIVYESGPTVYGLIGLLTLLAPNLGRAGLVFALTLIACSVFIIYKRAIYRGVIK